MTKTTISRPNQPDEIRDLTAEEETQRQADISRGEAERVVEAAVVAKKASGKQKLKDLGLDDEEIKALTGA